MTPTTYEYDDQGRVTRSAQGARAVALRYGADGLVSEVEDALGRVTRVTRDGVGRPTRSEGPPAGRAWEASYDADGQQSSLTPPGREPHTWQYSAVGRLLTSVLPAVEGMLASLGWRYDRDGLPLEVTREDGSKSRTEYDMSGRPVRVVSEASDLQFVYKEKTGQLERVEEAGGGSIDMEWEGPLLKAIAWAGIVAARMEVEYGSMGLPISQTLEQGPALAFEYDGDALPTKIGELELTWGASLRGWSRCARALASARLATTSTACPRSPLRVVAPRCGPSRLSMTRAEGSLRARRSWMARPRATSTLTMTRAGSHRFAAAAW